MQIVNFTERTGDSTHSS